MSDKDIATIKDAIERLQIVYHAAKQVLDEQPRFPVAISEMTDNEGAIAKIACDYAGTLQFITDASAKTEGAQAAIEQHASTLAIAARVIIRLSERVVEAEAGIERLTEERDFLKAGVNQRTSEAQYWSGRWYELKQENARLTSTLTRSVEAALEAASRIVCKHCANGMKPRIHAGSLVTHTHQDEKGKVTATVFCKAANIRNLDVAAIIEAARKGK